MHLLLNMVKIQKQGGFLVFLFSLLNLTNFQILLCSDDFRIFFTQQVVGNCYLIYFDIIFYNFGIVQNIFF